MNSAEHWERKFLESVITLIDLIEEIQANVVNSAAAKCKLIEESGIGEGYSEQSAEAYEMACEDCETAILRLISR